MRKRPVYVASILFFTCIWVFFPSIKCSLKISDRCALESEDTEGSVFLSAFLDNSDTEFFLKGEKQSESLLCISLSFIAAVFIAVNIIRFLSYALDFFIDNKYIDLIIRRSTIS